MNYFKSKGYWSLIILISIIISSLYFNYSLYNISREAIYQRDLWESVHKVDRIHIDHLNKDLKEIKEDRNLAFNELCKCRDKKLKIDKNERAIKDKISSNTN